MSFAKLHAVGTLFFIGLPMSTAYRFHDAVQALLTAWLIARPDILPSRESMQAQLEADEEWTRSKGRNVLILGSKYAVNDQAEPEAHQKRIVEFLRSNGIESGNADRKEGLVLDPWRQEVRKDFWMSMRGWNRLEKLGVSKQWLEGVAGEEAYAELMRRIIASQRAYEIETKRPVQQEICGWN